MTRRSLLAVTASLAAQQRRPYDILIRNGTAVDPSRNFRQKADVAIADSRIAAVAESIPAENSRDVIDATGLFVTPGLIDLHTHCYHSATELGIEADPVAARSGVTTWIDAGTFAYDQVPGFRRFIVEPSHARIYGFVYLYPSSRNPDIDPVEHARRAMRGTARAIEENSDILLGVKFQVGANMNGKYSYDLLKVARQLCDQHNLRLMAHISFAPPETEQVMELMRAGDIVTHAYNGHTLGITDAGGKLKPGVVEARKRGVIFDIGHGLGSFNFAASRRAMDAGFLPDTISTDIYNLNLNGPVYDMPTTMSKFLHLGMSFDEILVRTTINAAKAVRLPAGAGTLVPGAPADVALLAVEDGAFQLIDSQRNAVTAKQRIVCRLAICRGRRMRAVL